MKSNESRWNGSTNGVTRTSFSLPSSDTTVYNPGEYSHRFHPHQTPVDHGTISSTVECEEPIIARDAAAPVPTTMEVIKPVASASTSRPSSALGSPSKSK